MIRIVNNNNSFLADTSVPVLLIFLVLASAYFRFADLGSPGFWGDEETSSLPAMAVTEGHGSVMPSGMRYRRALPHTYSTALSGRIFGVDRDFSYRVPSAIFGVATVLIIFFGSRAILGTAVALVVTALLSFSEWHILLSRTARMYGPLLFFTLAFSFAVLNWNESKKLQQIVVAIISFTIAATINLLSMMVLPLLVLPFLMDKLKSRLFIQAVSVAAILGIGAWTYDAFFVNPPFTDFAKSGLRQPLESFEVVHNSPADSVYDYMMSWPASMLIVFGITVGVWLFAADRRVSLNINNPLRWLAVWCGWLAFSLCSFLGAVYGAAICLLAVLLLSAPLTWNRISSLAKPVAVCVSVLVIWFFFRTANDGLLEAMKASLRYPFPYLLSLAQSYPGVIIMFLLGIVDSLRAPIDGHRKTVRVLAIASLLPIFGLGLIVDWAPDRYLVTIYPFILLVAASGLVSVCKMLSNRLPHMASNQSALIAGLVVLSGVLGGHGLPQAFAVAPSSYGTEIPAQIPVYPDHRAPGCFVRAHLQETDIVVAEDALQQFWYAGRVDYWLRTPSSHQAYSYRDKFGHQRDIYVASRVTTSDVLESLAAEATRRIWVITSGETQLLRDFFLGIHTEQRQWLEMIESEHEPVLKGRDGLSATYCLNCNLETVDVDPWEYDCK